ncbi:hypothetical protein Rhal01_02928 [Rubritalea halochordaticola]|uniref:DUF839 domain-containing protein n=1 Tax=Rubritalea halochordaticola TaxID=714537 RepID=A0ABP9V232_9BACT
MKTLQTLAATALVGIVPTTLCATTEPAQMVGLNGYTTDPIFTVGETVNGYTPLGVLDGMAAYAAEDSVRLVCNHELSSSLGAPYSLDNGTVLTGARISVFTIDKESREVVDAELAFGTIYNRAGEVVDASSDLTFGGLNRLCSGYGVQAGQAGFVDDVYLTGEETGGGSMWALDVNGDAIWAAPALGVGGWEAATPLSIPSINETHVALLLGDDRGGAPLYLYIGEKDLTPGAGFLTRNGLATGKLYMWKSEGADQPSEFNGTGAKQSGKFVEVVNFDADMAGQPGFDSLGYATQANLDGQRDALGAFRFSRPEDLHTNPYNGSQVIFNSTGRDLGFDNSDLWGTIYLIDVKLNPAAVKKNVIEAKLTISYDGDDYAMNGVIDPSFGVRSPDNLCWSLDHNAYIQEDRSISAFGDSGEETSIWKLAPHTGDVLRVAQMDRSAIPAGQVDVDPSDLGDWESSGIIDVSEQFGAEKGSLFLFNVQAHSLRGGVIDSAGLVQGGQILFLNK